MKIPDDGSNSKIKLQGWRFGRSLRCRPTHHYRASTLMCSQAYCAPDGGCSMPSLLFQQKITFATNLVKATPHVVDWAQDLGNHVE